MEASLDAICSTDLDGVITMWNPAAQRSFGYSEADAVGRPIDIIVPRELREEADDILCRVRAGERIDRHETRRVSRDGRYLDVALSVSPVRDVSGSIIGASRTLRDLTEGKRTEAALRECEHRLAREIAAAQMLQSISTRLIREPSQETLLAQILDAAMELMGADAASIQMLAADGETLMLLGSRNFDPESAAFWQRVTTEPGSTCGLALHRNERVLVSDVEAWEAIAGTPHLNAFRRSAIRAAQSTPLLSRVGCPVGMLSTHWRTPHTPTDDDFRRFDVLARQAADLIERASVENAVRESEQRFRDIANSVPAVIWMGDASGNTYVNQAFLDLTGLSLEAACSSRWLDNIHPDDLAGCLETWGTAYERRERCELLYRLRGPDGEYRWVFGTGVPRYHADGSFAGFIGSALDVTERKLAREALTSIRQRLIDAQEGERRRIARELHDDINQRLTLMSLQLATLSQGDHQSAADIRSEVDAAREGILSLSRDVQALSHRLHPSRVEYLGIAAAAGILCREIGGHRGVTIDFRAESVPEGLPGRIGVCLYRVLQEALQNAVKHSGAATIEVRLVGEPDRITLTIRDCGVGFDLSTTRFCGLGLTSMQERLAAVQGMLSMQSALGEGTTVQAVVPLPQQ
jgi:PAS domain S-box-containing protein